MSFSDEPRFRIHAKQTAGNKWYLDATVEYKSQTIAMSTNPEDVASNIVHNDLGLELLSLIKKTEAVFRADGRKMVGDNNEAA